MGLLRALLGLAIFTAILVWATTPSSKDPAPPSESDPREVSRSSSTSLTVTASSPARGNPGAEALLDTFRERYGRELEAKFAPDGRLISIRGRPGRSKKVDGFNPQDPRKALARAREILENAGGLIGVTPDWPLERPIAKGSISSAQVYFQEGRSGVAIAPFGSVTVDLDSQGGLLGLDSSYIPGPTIVNSEKLSTADAKLRAAAAVPDSGAALRIDGGDAIFWVTRDRAGAPQARHAFEYYVQGRQVIVDASSGAVLHKKDVRQY